MRMMVLTFVSETRDESADRTLAKRLNVDLQDRKASVE